MANLLQILAWLLAVGVLVVGAVIMHRLFGLVGVVLLLVFMLPIAGIVVWAGRRRGAQASTSANRGRTQESKGAQGGRRR